MQEMLKEKVYLVCDSTDEKAASIEDTPDIGVEYLGVCLGRILKEDGTKIGEHASTTYGWLRKDLVSKLDDPSKYEITNLIGKEVPLRFKLENQEMVREKSWKEFQSTGLVLIINQILHIFGWAIVLTLEKDGDISNAYPARVRFRGFDGESAGEAYIKLSDYMVNNAETLKEESES